MSKTAEVKDIEVVEKSVAQRMPSDVISEAVAKGANLEQIEKLMLLQEKWEATQAKKAYVKAMADFKANAPLVDKDKVNNQYKSKYTSLGNLINTVSPVLSKFGLSASWDIEQNGIIKVTCKMTHELGHSETASMSAPADVSGAKNVIQQIKSTITYLKAVTFESIAGLASTDANLDDDGQGAVEYISDKEKSQIVDLITATKTDMVKFCKAFEVEELAKLPKVRYQQAVTALTAKANKAKAVAK